MTDETLAKFGHHPDETIDAEIEVERLEGLLAEAHAGLLVTLNFCAATPKGIAIKENSRRVLRETGWQGNFGYVN